MELGIFLLEPGGACDQGDFLTPPSLLCTPFPHFFPLNGGWYTFLPGEFPGACADAIPHKGAVGRVGMVVVSGSLLGAWTPQGCSSPWVPSVGCVCVGGGEVVGEQLQGSLWLVQ